MKKNKSSIINFYETIPKQYLDEVENPNYGKTHLWKLPFRAVVVAPSGSGKTNFICNLIKVFSDKKGTFRDIHIITRNKDEPLYRWLETISPSIIISEGIETIPALDKFDKEYNHLVIFDDLVLEKNQKEIQSYYIRARKLNVSVLYLSQSYFLIPRVIRINSNYLVILKMGGLKDIKAIMTEYNLDMPKEELLELYKKATKQKLSPFIIVADEPDLNKKFMSSMMDYL